MGYIELGASQVFRGGNGDAAPVIYVIDAPEHPFEEASLARGRAATIVTVPIRAWGDALTPWPEAGLYRGEPDFGGKAPETLAELCDEVIPALEASEGLAPVRRGLCGYSLGGLFALYALTHADTFVACGCLSGSVWYEGWVEHLDGLELDLSGRFAFLSVGTKEKRGGRPLMRTVQDRMEACANILRLRGCEVAYVTGPGNHLQHVAERFDTGLSALDAFLARA